METDPTRGTKPFNLVLSRPYHDGALDHPVRIKCVHPNDEREDYARRPDVAVHKKIASRCCAQERYEHDFIKLSGPAAQEL